LRPLVWLGVALQVSERDSLWENPHAAATSWKPCAERRSDEISDLVPENETSGFIFIHAEGGLNQQRIAVRMCHFHNLCPLSRWHVTHELFHSLGLKRKMLM